jgi:hypothetical protein
MTLDTEQAASAPTSMDAQLESINSKLDELPKREPTAEERDKAEYDKLSAAFDKAAAKPAPGEDEPEAEAEEVEAKVKPDRHPDGKFKSKLPEGAKAQAAEEEADDTDDDSQETKAAAPETKEAKKPAVEAPKHWSEKVRAEFAKLDPEAQRELAKETTEMRQNLSRQGRALQELQPVAKVLQEHKALFEQNGVSYDQGIAALLRAQVALSDPNTARNALLKLAETYNIDLGNGAEPEDQDWVDPNVTQLRATVEQLQNRLAHYERHTAEQMQEQQSAAATNFVDQFAQGKEDFEALADEIELRVRMYRAAYPQAPANEILAKAYEEARALNPATRDKLVNEEIERKAKAAEKARKAASLNVASSDKPGRMSEYDRLSAAYDKAMSA